VILLGDFNAQVGNDASVQKGVIDQYGDADTNDNGRFLLQLCCNNTLCIMNTFFQHRHLHKHTWCRDSLDQRSITDLSIFSKDLFQSAFDLNVKTGEELSSDHHLVGCNSRLEKPTASAQTCKSSRSNQIKWEAVADNQESRTWQTT